MKELFRSKRERKYLEIIFRDSAIFSETRVINTPFLSAQRPLLSNLYHYL